MIVQGWGLKMVNSPKIFISYAREDQEDAYRLSRELKALGAEVWLDLANMIGGLDFRIQIEDAVDECDFVVLLLSRSSIDKTGYVQKEKRYILDKLNHMPFGKVFLIPVRLEECQPRNKQIRNIHYIDLFPSWDKGIKDISKALNFNKDEIDRLEAKRKTMPTDPLALSVKDYFEIVLPTILKWKGEAVTIVNKKVRFILSDQIDESWTLNLVPPAATIVAKDEGDVDLTIKLTSECMQSILKGQFDAKEAIADGEIEIFGDLSVLKSVGILFSGNSNSLN